MDELQKAIQALRDRINAALAGLPPLEQYEASSEVSYGIRALTSFGKEFAGMTATLEEKIAAYAEKTRTEARVTAEASAKDALLAAGLYILKTDSESAVQAAIGQAQTSTREAIQAEQAAREKITGRRAELVKEKKLPQIAAEAIPEAVLALDDYAAPVAKIAGRLDKLKALGLTETNSAALVAEVSALSTDEAGDKLFDGKHATIAEAVKAARNAGPINPLLGAGGGGGETTPATKPRRFF